ncbi:hypothetical protein D3C72_1608120 [compost metagenome]
MRQRDRQTELLTEIQHRFDLLHAAVLQHQLRQRAKSHFLAVVQMMALFEHGKAVVDGMRSRQSAAFKADAAQVGIGLDNAFDRLRHHSGLDRQLGFDALRQQRLITQARQAEGCQRRFAARHTGGLRIETRLRLKISRQRIAHACHQQPHRGLGDNCTVHHHHVGIAWVNQVFGKFALFGINH